MKYDASIKYSKMTLEFRRRFKPLNCEPAKETHLEPWDEENLTTVPSSDKPIPLM